jgi:hypothetical protein
MQEVSPQVPQVGGGGVQIYGMHCHYVNTVVRWNS